MLTSRAVSSLNPACISSRTSLRVSRNSLRRPPISPRSSLRRLPISLRTLRISPRTLPISLRISLRTLSISLRISLRTLPISLRISLRRLPISLRTLPISRRISWRKPRREASMAVPRAIAAAMIPINSGLTYTPSTLPLRTVILPLGAGIVTRHRRPDSRNVFYRAACNNGGVALPLPGGIQNSDSCRSSAVDWGGRRGVWPDSRTAVSMSVTKREMRFSWRRPNSRRRAAWVRISRRCARVMPT